MSKPKRKKRKAHHFQTVSQILASLPPHKRYPLAKALGR